MKRFIAIGNRIKELRGDKNQVEFAKEVNIPLTTYQRYESGERAPKKKALQQIAQACDVPVDFILTGDETNLRKQLLKEVQELKIEALVDSMPKRLGEIDPALEWLFLHWTDLSQEDKDVTLQYVFYKKKVEHLFDRIKKIEEEA